VFAGLGAVVRQIRAAMDRGRARLHGQGNLGQSDQRTKIR
jgi:hypothetical protein